MSTCFCTLAIGAPHRARARVLCVDAPSVPWIVLTDEPADFADLPVRAVRHVPTGPMAADYLQRLGPTGDGRGAAASHDTRFAVRAALRDFDTAIFLAADSRAGRLPPLGPFAPGLAVIPLGRKSIAEHLEMCGSWRLSAFKEIARVLTGGAAVLQSARWCHETFYAVTKDGREDNFFSVWGRAAALLQRHGVFSGAGGVMGLAAVCAGWSVDYDVLADVAPLVAHESGGPKGA